jgi:hypothetical protein
MSEIYIRVDSSTRQVTFVHKMPFDTINGLNSTRDELLKTGYFVSEYPEPQNVLGKRAVPYYDHEAKKVYYEYIAAPLTSSERLDLLEDAMNEVLMNSAVSAIQNIETVDAKDVVDADTALL